MKCNMGHFGASTELNEINFATLRSGDFKGITYSDADFHTNGQSGLGAFNMDTKSMVIYGVGLAALIGYFMYMRKKA